MVSLLTPYGHLFSQNTGLDSQDLHGTLGPNCISAVVTIKPQTITCKCIIWCLHCWPFPSYQTGVLNWPLIDICWLSNAGVRSAFPSHSWATCQTSFNGTLSTKFAVLIFKVVIKPLFIKYVVTRCSYCRRCLFTAWWGDRRGRLVPGTHKSEQSGQCRARKDLSVCLSKLAVTTWGRLSDTTTNICPAFCQDWFVVAVVVVVVVQ